MPEDHRDISSFAGNVTNAHFLTDPLPFQVRPSLAPLLTAISHTDSKSRKDKPESFHQGCLVL